MKKGHREERVRRPGLVPNPKAKLLDQVREVMRFHHYSLRTERTYCAWIWRYLLFHRDQDRSGPSGGWRHPREMGGPEIAKFLAHLAQARNVAASTQNQALNALVFLYQHVLQIEVGDIGEYARVTRPSRLPEVLSKEETARVLAALEPGTTRLIILLLYGTGMRIMEALRLRVKDIDFAGGKIIVRSGNSDFVASGRGQGSGNHFAGQAEGGTPASDPAGQSAA